VALLDGRAVVGCWLRWQGIWKGPSMHLLRRFLQSEKGATAIEYAIIAGGIALAIVAGATTIGTTLNTTFTAVANAFK
jgi:pilus assembly protein Flp/PilA